MSGCASTSTTLYQERATLLEQNIGVGKSKADVESFLRAQGAEHSFSQDESSFLVIYRQQRSSGWATELIQYTISLDDDEKVSDVSRRYVYHAP